MAKYVLTVLAEGFEEIEAITPVDVLRRLDVDVTVASLDGPVVRGARGIAVQADATLAEVADRVFDLIVLPGGMPGAANLAASARLADMLRRQHSERRMIAAICAAPAVVLQPLGLLGDERVACYPAFQRRLGEANRTDERLCVGEKLITAAGPGVAMDFVLALAERLKGKETADELAKAMLVERCSGLTQWNARYGHPERSAGSGFWF